jgi:predicted RNA-binding protein YlqC (UPF0109 family)
VVFVQKLVEYITQALVDNPDKVVVTQVNGEKAVVLEVRVASEDMGKVIGKQGKIVKAIRTVIKAAATKENKRAVVEILHSDADMG